MEVPKTKRFIPTGFELGTILSWPNRSIPHNIPHYGQFTLFLGKALTFSLINSTYNLNTDTRYSRKCRQRTFISLFRKPASRTTVPDPDFEALLKTSKCKTHFDNCHSLFALVSMRFFNYSYKDTRFI